MGLKFKVGDTIMQTKYVTSGQSPWCSITKIEEKEKVFVVHHKHRGENATRRIKGSVISLNSFFASQEEAEIEEAIKYAITHIGVNNERLT